MSIHVLYGTETGNAEMVAEDISEVLGDNTPIAVSDMSNFPVSALSRDTFYIIVCSTYGDGELPHAVKPFFDALNEEQPELNGLRFAVFGLGDSFYETYNHGSEIITQALVERGAVQVGIRGQHDATSGELPCDVAIPWAKEIMCAI